MPIFAVHICKMHKQQKVLIFMSSIRHCLSHAAEAAAELTCKQSNIRRFDLQHTGSKLRFFSQGSSARFNRLTNQAAKPKRRRERYWPSWTCHPRARARASSRTRPIPARPFVLTGRRASFDTNLCPHKHCCRICFGNHVTADHGKPGVPNGPGV